MRRAVFPTNCIPGETLRRKALQRSSEFSTTSSIFPDIFLILILFGMKEIEVEIFAGTVLYLWTAYQLSVEPASNGGECADEEGGDSFVNSLI